MSFDKIIEQCSYLLYNSPEAEDTASYINERLSSDSQKKFSFGYFPPTDKLNLLTSIIGEDCLKINKLLYTKESSDRISIYSYFENYQMIMPYRNLYGDIIGIVGRSILSDEDRKNKKISKYKNTAFNKGNHLFGLFESKQSILQSGFAYIVEGQFDVIKAHEKGLTNIVALGSSNMTAYQAALISRYTDSVFLVLDNDEAGEKGRKRILSKYGDRLKFNNLYLPDGYKDIDDYLSQNSYESLSFLC